METYIAILRGINVGGYRIIKMDALRQLLTVLGFVNVHTYIQSGNIVFQYKKSDAKKLQELIADAVSNKFGFFVPVIVIESDKLKQIIKANPFLKNRSKNQAFLHVTFLAEDPDTESFDKVKKNDFHNDEFILTERAVYLYCPDNYRNTKLTNGFFEEKLKVVATTRNWKTVNELLNISDKITTGEIK